ncbi:DUF3999 family protein [Ramlibacter alkalitolerans]|uniref:DUF3999 family protein n=1 Tax=Ramlibacter alkalitolerans TaxID=2039631 RepID=A0ABS1JRS3_9BURK|nr:DUF3999 family protein [Ramlibacter alkalitolerans]MBL0426923.1 DUF3999 family protein [Ramlibacter alkalitolerans]
MKGSALFAGAFCAAALAAADPGPGDFAWRATLDTSGHTGLVRVAVPAEALGRLQSPELADLRVFDGQGQPVAFAFSAPALPPAAARAQTQLFAALPLYAVDGGPPPLPGALQMRIERKGAQQSVWVDLARPPSEAQSAARRLDAALFDTRAQKEPVSALVLRAHLPANTPVHFTAQTSPDLARWTPLAVQGRLFRFEGAGAPANDRLELAAPVSLQDRYLRLDWSGQAGVVVDAVTGLLAASRPEPVLPALTLGAPVADGAAALEWSLDFATPLRGLQLATTQPATLVPVRVLGRKQPSDPWRLLADTVVYRIGAGADESSNPPLELAQPSVRWLRIEATHGTRLQGLPLTAQVRFEPRELVFVAGAAGPYRLAAGRTATPPGALPLATLSATTSTRMADLPLARIVAVESAPAAEASWWTGWLPRGVDGKTAGLWLVLGAGVLLLGGVAWSLLRQLAGPPGQD